MPQAASRSAAGGPATSAPGAATARRWTGARPFLIAAAIAIAAFLPFSPALTAGLVEFDDPNLLLQRDEYRGLGPENVRWMFTTTLLGHYQPLTWMSYGIDYLLAGSPEPPDAESLRRIESASAGPFGRAVAMFHVTNLLLHSLNAALVFFVARRLIGAALAGGGPPRAAALDLGAAAAALMFGVHPLRVESVAWVTERRDVLSACFLLLALIAYLRAFPPQRVRPASAGWYGVSVALLLVSLLSKAWGMSLFVILVIADWYPLRRLPPTLHGWAAPSARAVLVQKAPFAVLGIAAAIMAGYATSSGPFARLSWELWGLVPRVCQAAYGLMFYLQKSVWPVRLCALYEVPLGEPMAQPRFIAGLIFVAVAGLSIFAFRRRIPALLAAGAAYAVTIAPVLGFFQSGPQLVADRYAYLATIPWAILAGGLITSWAARRGTRAALVMGASALGIVTLVLAGATWHQTTYWRSTERLVLRCLETGHDGPFTRINNGVQLARRGDPEGALRQFDRATELSPRHGEAWFRRGTALSALGRPADAEESYARAAGLMSDSWRAHLALGLLYMNLDRPDRAAERFRAAIANVEDPRSQSFSARPYLMLAGALDALGDYAGERQMLLKAAQFPETRAEALDHLRDLDAENPG